jgi:hypothetical protein
MFAVALLKDTAMLFVFPKLLSLFFFLPTAKILDPMDGSRFLVVIIIVEF